MKSTFIPEAVQAFARLRHMFEVPAALALVGTPGVGKTTGVLEAARREGLFPVVLRGHSLTELHAIGYPSVVEGRVEFVPPREFQALDEVKTSRGLLIFADEVNTASSIVRAQLLQLLEQGRMHSYDFNGAFPAVVVCAMNSSEDAGVVELPRNVRSRMIFVEVEPPSLQDIVDIRLRGGYLTEPCENVGFDEDLMWQRIEKIKHLIPRAEEAFLQEREDHFVLNSRMFVEVGLRVLGLTGINEEVYASLLCGAMGPEIGIEALRATWRSSLEELVSKEPEAIREIINAASNEELNALFEEFVSKGPQDTDDIWFLAGFTICHVQIMRGNNSNVTRLLQRFREIKGRRVGLKHFYQEEIRLLSKWEREYV